MTTSMGVQLTAGQKCLLDLLQRKLFNTIQSYAKLSIERQQEDRNQQQKDEIDDEMLQLKEKIRRISARQKRFTLEIINGNGNNTIPKESFFEALGLVTKEALIKLNSKSNERRRRTTANPRFSHEAIQAKRALEPLTKRLEPRVKGENNKRESTRKTNQSSRNPTSDNINNNNNPTRSNTSANNNKTNANTNNMNITSGRGANQQASNSNKHINNNINNNRASNRANVTPDSVLSEKETMELLERFGCLQKEINMRVSQIKNKKDSNRQLMLQNERIRKRGLDIISAIHKIDPNFKFRDDVDQTTSNNDNLDGSYDNDNRNIISTTNNEHNQNDQKDMVDPLEMWIDLKCEESLDPLDGFSSDVD